MKPDVNKYDPFELHIAILEIESGNIAFLEKVYDVYARPVYGWILRNTKDVSIAEEILFETFLSMWQNIKRFEAAKCSFFIWLIRLSCQAMIKKGYRIQLNYKMKIDE